MLVSMRIYTAARRACAANVPSERHSDRGYLNIEYRSGNVNDPDVRQPNWRDDAAIDDFFGKVKDVR